MEDLLGNNTYINAFKFIYKIRNTYMIILFNTFLNVFTVMGFYVNNSKIY